MELIDLDFSHAIQCAARVMNRSNAGLRKALEDGGTKSLIDLLRSDRPLNRSERCYIADLLSGKWGREKGAKRANPALKSAREAAGMVLARKKANKKAGRRESIAATVAIVVEKWNAHPHRSGVPITVDQLMAYRRNSKSRK